MISLIFFVIFFMSVILIWMDCFDVDYGEFSRNPKHEYLTGLYALIAFYFVINGTAVWVTIGNVIIGIYWTLVFIFKINVNRNEEKSKVKESRELDG